MSYFKGDALLFTLSKRQRDFLASPPATLQRWRIDRHTLRTATILERNGLIALTSEDSASFNSAQRVAVTPAGTAAVAFYDTLKKLVASRGA